MHVWQANHRIGVFDSAVFEPTIVGSTREPVGRNLFTECVKFGVRPELLCKVLQSGPASTREQEVMNGQAPITPIKAAAVNPGRQN